MGDEEDLGLVEIGWDAAKADSQKIIDELRKSRTSLRKALTYIIENKTNIDLTACMIAENALLEDEL